MKAFTLSSRPKMVRRSIFGFPQADLFGDSAPKAQAGILVRRDEGVLRLAPNFFMPLSKELIALCEPVAAEAELIRIMRASTDKLSDGRTILVPERTDDSENALVLLDIGRGDYTSVRYEDSMQILLRAKRELANDAGLEELALAVLKPKQSLHVYRSSRPWYAFGSEVVAERLSIRLRGDNLSCEQAN